MISPTMPSTISVKGKIIFNVLSTLKEWLSFIISMISRIKIKKYIGTKALKYKNMSFIVFIIIILVIF